MPRTMPGSPVKRIGVSSVPELSRILLQVGSEVAQEVDTLSVQSWEMCPFAIEFQDPHFSYVSSRSIPFRFLKTFSVAELTVSFFIPYI